MRKIQQSDTDSELNQMLKLADNDIKSYGITYTHKNLQ